MSDSDCPAGEVCDVEATQCVRASIVTNNKMPPVNDGDVPDMGGADATNPADEDTDVVVTPDTGSDDVDPPVECVPDCGANEVCDNGQCVSACMPACTAPEICTADGCTLPDCTTAGQACDPARPEQGGFVCATDGAGDGVCLSTCTEAFAASDCGTGEYCWDLGPVNACLITECTTHTDCPDDGTCVAFDNDFSACFPSGARLVGDSCDPSAFECEQGAACRPTGTSIGVCAATCDLFGAAPGCPSNQRCASFYTVRTGLCTAVDTGGSGPYEYCDTPGAACADGLPCLRVNEVDSVCLAYCRPGQNDCAAASSVVPSACDNFVFPGERAIGVCFAECQTNTDCGTGNLCINDICRATCATDAECCPAGQACDFKCVTGLCE